ncbi:chitin synthase chs-2-like [Erpetoichthys calabaricus]|uniref:chitin synthase chs-2-like n=1 Tax=Erpetoichthys calabaricus TaxID=27687 RepID=UPI002234B308|nr:chitin synthase chs-2-like [Erpetoichthys calabaricus]
MDLLKNRVKDRESRHKDTWDPFQLNPVGAEKENKKQCFVFAQYLVAVVIGLFVLVSAFFSKASFLILTTLASQQSLKKADWPFHLLMVACALVVPNVLIFLKSLWKCLFKSFSTPRMKTLALVCLVEMLVSLGSALVALVAMPQLDILTNLFLSGSVCFFSAIFQATIHLKLQNWKIIFPICSSVLVAIGYMFMGMDYFIRSSTDIGKSYTDKFIAIAFAIFGTVLVSLNWWENAFRASERMKNTLAEMEKSRNFIYLISSILRTVVVGGVFVICFILNGGDWPYFQNVPNDVMELGIGIFVLQAVSSAVCHWFGVVACKIHAVKGSFALPTVFTTPAILTAFSVAVTLDYGLVFVGDGISKKLFCSQFLHYESMNSTKLVLDQVAKSICQTPVLDTTEPWGTAVLGLEGFCLWMALLCCTYYIWNLKLHKIERTSKIFVRRMYEAAFVDQSMLLNTRMKIPNELKSEEDVENCFIYLCATMWHETYDEMLKILTSMFRLDRYRGDPYEEHKDNFEFECHIYVDDAFWNTDEVRLTNTYVNDLINVIIEVYRVFTNKEPDEVTIFETPYGGRISCVLPEGNMLHIHLKDKQLIRNKKRWSQIMYMYYLLGWKGYLSKRPHSLRTISNPCRASLVSLSMNDNIFILPQNESDNKRKYVTDENTYIMALDGDTDFHPSALILLVDRLRMYQNVGAACGRIHPTGMGPMVWYQKFEYAVGHWLQKTAEHVFGSVLCSPGCFSLFRGSALMDDSVVKRYTTTATKAGEYVQYDQGEDRWLCTLLLQQGWRVEYNAASDAYTNAPQEFKEFYNQRRRWGPSTLANTLDLLHSGKETSRKNSSISMLYILYQMLTVGSSILGPASVCLMIAGAFSFVFNWNPNFAIMLATIPPVVYVIICYTTSPDFQVMIASIMSVLYAFLMTATFLSIIGQMIKEETFITPSGLFLVSMSILYLTTALLHPQEFTLLIYGLMYVICIPSGYLLLTIYSLVNMHVVSWGTRETSRDKEEEKTVGVLCKRDCSLCCWDIKIEVNQETKNAVLQQLQKSIQQSQPHSSKNQQQSELQPLLSESNTADDLEEAVEEKKKEKEKGKKERQKSNHHGKGRREQDMDVDQDRESFGSDDDTSCKEEEDRSLNDDESQSELETQPESPWVGPVKREFLKKLTTANMKRNLEEQIKQVLKDKKYEDLCIDMVGMLNETLFNEIPEKFGPEDIPDEITLEELRNSLLATAKRVLQMNGVEGKLDRKVKNAIKKTLMAPQVDKLPHDENDFWKKLIKRYLFPLNDDKVNKEQVKKELISLRNKATFLYFIVNVLWVVATFFLQAIGEDISIKIPKIFPNGTIAYGEYLNVEPIGFMFLLSFAFLLLIQFMAMLYHRVYTLIHVVSYRSSEKSYKEKDDDDSLIYENQDPLPIQMDVIL